MRRTHSHSLTWHSRTFLSCELAHILFSYSFCPQSTHTHSLYRSYPFYTDLRDDALSVVCRVNIRDFKLKINKKTYNFACMCVQCAQCSVYFYVLTLILIYFRLQCEQNVSCIYLLYFPHNRVSLCILCECESEHRPRCERMSAKTKKRKKNAAKKSSEKINEIK